MTESLWAVLGIAGAVIFYSRFYLQWYVSERRGESIIPIAFWYMSCAGSLMLLTYAIIIQSPLGALSQCFNIVVYTRNLVHIWNKRRPLGRTAYWLIHVLVALVSVTAIGFVIRIWLKEYAINQDQAVEVARQTWFWLIAGLVGQALFALRFGVQWLVTEIRRESVVPPVFWYLSVAAATLQIASFAQRAEWVFLAGGVLSLVIYVRNIMLVSAKRAAEKPA